MPAPDAPLTVDDRLAVAELLARYNWAVDCDDADAFAASFTEAGEFVTADRVYRGHAELVELMARLHSKRGAGQRSLFHHVDNVVLDGDHDRARLVAQLIGPRISESGVHTLQLGWYDDVVERTAAGWRFARRHFRAWPDTAPATSPVPFPAEATA